jgi:hypothetical protein
MIENEVTEISARVNLPVISSSDRLLIRIAAGAEVLEGSTP